jgi:hypothetical protein
MLVRGAAALMRWDTRVYLVSCWDCWFSSLGVDGQVVQGGFLAAGLSWWMILCVELTRPSNSGRFCRGGGRFDQIRHLR